MINLSNITAGLVLGLVVTSAVPSFAASAMPCPATTLGRRPSSRASAMTAASRRTAPSALRECNQLAEPIKGYTLITSQFAVYRNCMAGRGEVE